MTEHRITNALLHHTLVKHILDHGFAPDTATLTKLLEANTDDVIRALHDLHEQHGLVLHPNSSHVWVIHPFSLAPTHFWVTDGDRGWWGNCAWCSLGIAALVERDVTIQTAIGAEGDRIALHINDGRLIEDEFLVHFPIPMKRAWDNVIYTCSTMLIFENEQQVDSWCHKHAIPKGDLQPISKIWRFAKVWYGNHLNRNWKKWTNEEAQRIFNQFGLTGEIWEVPTSESRF